MCINHYPWCIGTHHIGTSPSVQGRGHAPPPPPQRTRCQPGTPSIQGPVPLSTGIPLLRCSNLFNLDLTVQGHPLIGRYVQYEAHRQAGGWHPSGMLSCSEKSLVSFQRPIVASDKGDFQIKTLESLCWCCTWDIVVFRASALHFTPWVHYVLLHECVTFFHMSVFISTWMHYVLG